MINQINPRRVVSIDALRAITIIVMVFVNALSAVQNVPAWAKHTLADADWMYFPDVVFPSFLFIVGMSIPFAMNYRLKQGDTVWQVNKHVLYRTFALVVIGLFMVNAEEGWNQSFMLMPIHLWSLVMYIAVFFIWGSWGSKNKALTRGLQAAGAASLVVLATLYHGGKDGHEWMTIQWWGILGLIGWAYLIGCIGYQLTRGRILGLMIGVAICTGYFAINHWSAIKGSPFLETLFCQEGNFAHGSIVLLGVATSMIFFDQSRPDSLRRRYTELALLIVGVVVAGYWLRPYYTISKIYASPTWCFYSAAICMVIFGVLYAVIDLKGHDGWFAPLRATAANPMLIYLIPYLLDSAMNVAGLRYPAPFYDGLTGAIWCVVFTGLMVWLVGFLSRRGVRLAI